MVHLFLFHSLHFFTSEKANLGRNTLSTDCYFSSNSKIWDKRSSATKHLRKNITKWNTLGFMSKTFLKELLMFSVPLHKVSAGNCWQGLYLNIWIYIRTSINIQIHMYKKAKLMVWKLDPMGTHGSCQGRAVASLLGWGSGGHRCDGAQGVCWSGHPPQQHCCRTETALPLCFWARCRKPLMPSMVLLSPEIIYKISLRVFLALYNVLYTMHCEIIKYWWMGLLPITWPADTWNVLLSPLLFAQAVRLKSQTPYHFPSHRSPYFLLLEKPNHHTLCQVTFLKCCKI